MKVRGFSLIIRLGRSPPLHFTPELKMAFFRRAHKEGKKASGLEKCGHMPPQTLFVNEQNLLATRVHKPTTPIHPPLKKYRYIYIQYIRCMPPNPTSIPWDDPPIVLGPPMFTFGSLSSRNLVLGKLVAGGFEFPRNLQMSPNIRTGTVIKTK